MRLNTKVKRTQVLSLMAGSGEFVHYTYGPRTPKGTETSRRKARTGSAFGPERELLLPEDIFKEVENNKKKHTRVGPKGGLKTGNENLKSSLNRTKEKYEKTRAVYGNERGN